MSEPRAWMSSDRVRTFVAVELGIATLRKIADAQAALRAEAERAGWRVAWVNPAQMHVTLRFLGHVAREVTGAVADCLERVAANRAPFDVEAIGAGAFPDAARPRVLWVGLRDDGSLARLAADVEGALEGIGFAREKRTFHAHVTLGRVKEAPGEASTGSGGSGGSGDVLAPLLQTSFGTSVVRDVTLFESRLRRSGVEYLPLARVALGGESRGSRAGKEESHAG